MPSIELGPTRPVRAVETRITRHEGGQPRQPAKAGEPAQPPIVTSNPLDAGDAPVDVQRVDEIRKAIETGDYPLVPAKIADAMIAAGFLLRYRK